MSCWTREPSVSMKATVMEEWRFSVGMVGENHRGVGTHYCLAVGNDEGLELDETDEEQEVCEGDKEQVEKDEG